MLSLKSFKNNNDILQNSCPAIGAFGKLTQIYEIVRSNRGDLVSKLPFITNAVTSSGKEFTLLFKNFVKTNFFICLARLITVWMETQDVNLYINFGVSVVANIGVVWSSFAFVPKKIE